MSYYGPPPGSGRFPPPAGAADGGFQQPPPLAFQSAMLAAPGGPRPLAFGAGPPPMRPPMMMGFAGPRGPPMAPFHVGGGLAPLHIVPPHMQLQLLQPPSQQQQQAAAAAFLPPGWSEHYTPQGALYFYNAATGASTYERPVAPTPQPSAVAPAAAATSPDSSGGRWIEYTDAASGKLYYYHTATKATVWDQPEAFRMQQARDEVERMQQAAAAPAAAAAAEEPQAATSSSALDDALASEEEPAAESAAASTTAAPPRKPKPQESEDPAVFAHLTREQRVAEFKAFLEQRQVPPQLKWPDVQRFVVREGLARDPRWRFTALSAGDKKQSFAEYCTQAVNRQNIEKRRQVKKNREDFLALLADFQAIFAPAGAFAKDRSSATSGRTSATAAAPPPIDLDDVASSPHFYTVRQDPRWLVIEDQKEKRSLLNGFLHDIARKHEQAVAKQRDVVKKRFAALVRQKAAARELAPLPRDKSRRPLLDAELKQQLWQLLDKLAPALGGKNAAGLKTVEKHDVYAWGEDALRALRDEDHERRKRERELWRDREAQLLRELEAALRAMAAAAELTPASPWEHVRARLAAAAAGAAGGAADADAAAAAAAGDTAETRQLSERAQVRVFERVVKELHAALRPAVDAVRSFLAQSGGGAGFEVSDACTFEGFADALTDGIRASIEAKKPEDGEEADQEPAAPEKRSSRAEKHAKQSELEALVQQEATESSSSSSPAYPSYVREVFGLLVQSAKEKKAKKTGAGDRDGARAARSTSRSRKGKRRRRDSSPSPHSGRSASRSRSRSRSRSASPHRSRKRRSHHQPLPQQLPSKQHEQPQPTAQPQPAPVLDRSVVWNTGGSSSAAAAAAAFAFDPLHGDEDMRLPLATRRATPPPTALTAEQESARAEEIIRQARLKLQRAAAASNELEEGEELEDGEEPEEPGAESAKESAGESAETGTTGAEAAE